MSDARVTGLHGPTVDELADVVRDEAVAAVAVYYDADGAIKVCWTAMLVPELCHLLVALDAEVKADATASGGRS